MKPPGRGQETSQGRKPLVCSGFKPSPGRATEESYLIAIYRPGARFFLYPYRGLTPPANVLNAPSGLGILYFKLFFTFSGGVSCSFFMA